jgi:hypothetical protein
MAFTYTFAFNSVPNAANPYGVPNLNFYNRDFTLSTSAGLKLDFSGVAVQNIEITYSKLAGYSPSGRPVLGDPQGVSNYHELFDFGSGGKTIPPLGKASPSDEFKLTRPEGIVATVGPGILTYSGKLTYYPGIDYHSLVSTNGRPFILARDPISGQRTTNRNYAPESGELPSTKLDVRSSLPRGDSPNLGITTSRVLVMGARPGGSDASTLDAESIPGAHAGWLNGRDFWSRAARRQRRVDAGLQRKSRSLCRRARQSLG